MEWKEVDICQLCDSVSETYKGNASEVVLINTSDVLDGKCLNHEYVPNKKLKGQFKKTFRKGDILYSEIRPANKRFCFVDFEPKDYIASTKLMVLRAHEDVDPQYLYQILRSNDTLTQLQMLAESRSGTFPQITYSELSNIMVSLPSQKAQKNIVSILSSLDRKIELNNKINADLEEMAQAIFKNWFVDFEPFKDGKFVDSELGMIPEGWKVGCLGDIAEITSGKRPPKKSKDKTKDLFIPLIGASDIMGFTSDVLYERPILVIGRVGTHGVVQRFQEKCWPSDNTLVIESSYYNYVYQLLKRIDYSAINRGSTQPLITQTDVKNTDVIIAPENVLKEYESITSTLFSKHRANNKENSRLSTLRDTLLPRLMSGEIEVPE
mgnify:CR=1 FL=1